jgi:hypothetical protein
MPLKREKYVPKHRQAKHRKETSPFITVAPRQVLRSTAVFSSVAVAATAGVVSTGVASSPLSVSSAAQGFSEVTEPLVADDREERTAPVSRSSDRRDTTDPAKEAALAATDSPAVSRTEDVSDDDPREIARALLAEFGFSSDQFGCLDSLYMSESGWRVNADNPSSSAYGIPQALTETHDLPADYMTNPVTQIEWGLDYIRSSYGTPCAAWDFKQSNNWY